MNHNRFCGWFRVQCHFSVCFLWTGDRFILRCGLESLCNCCFLMASIAFSLLPNRLQFCVVCKDDSTSFPLQSLDFPNYLLLPIPSTSSPNHIFHPFLPFLSSPLLFLSQTNTARQLLRTKVQFTITAQILQHAFHILRSIPRQSAKLLIPHSTPHLRPTRAHAIPSICLAAATTPDARNDGLVRIVGYHNKRFCRRSSARCRSESN